MPLRSVLLRARLGGLGGVGDAQKGELIAWRRATRCLGARERGRRGGKRKGEGVSRLSVILECEVRGHSFLV